MVVYSFYIFDRHSKLPALSRAHHIIRISLSFAQPNASIQGFTLVKIDLYHPAAPLQDPSPGPVQLAVVQ